MKMTDKLLDVFMKYAKIVIVPLATFLLCATFILTNIVTPFIKCFAVDSSGNLYVGVNDTVEVYAGNVLVDTFSPEVNGTYLFTITNDDTFVICTPTGNHYYDLRGNALDTHRNNDGMSYTVLQFKKHHFQSASKDSYVMICNLGWARIVKNGTTVVYGISVISFVVKALFFASAAALFAVGMSFFEAAFAELRDILQHSRIDDSSRSGDGGAS